MKRTTQIITDVASLLYVSDRRSPRTRSPRRHRRLSAAARQLA